MLFSKSTLTLDHIEHLIEHFTEEAQSQHEFFRGKWEKDVNYFRIDGNTKSEKRNFYFKEFNDISN